MTVVTVQGRCPACGARALFLGEGGYITCSVRECPDPAAIADLLRCDLHDRLARWLVALTGPPAPPGCYRVRESDLRLTPIENRTFS